MKYTPTIISGVAALILVWLGVASLGSCGKAGRDNVPRTVRQFVPEQVAGWQVQDEVLAYGRRTIFDYIDGAGEVYLSFGFRDVTVFRYLREGSPEITVEIFDMGTAEDAYGVFSHSREYLESNLGSDFASRGGVACFWQDRYYVCVVCYEQTEDAGEALMELARGIKERLPEERSRPGLVEILPDDGLVPNSVRFFHLHSSLNYHYYVARENLLQMSPDTRAVMARYAPGTTFLLCVEYPNEEDASEGYRGFLEGYLPEADGKGPVPTENGKWTAADVQGRYVLAVFDADSEEQATQLIENLAARLAQYTE